MEVLLSDESFMSSSRRIRSFLCVVYILGNSDAEKSSGYDAVAERNCYNPEVDSGGRLLVAFIIPLQN